MHHDDTETVRRITSDINIDIDYGYNVIVNKNYRKQKCTIEIMKFFSYRSFGTVIKI